MRKNFYVFFFIVILSIVSSIAANAQVIISQYYEGNGTNKWIELTNIGTAAVNTASPQLKLGIWPASGTSGNIKFSGSPAQTVNLTVTIPAKGTVLIGNTGNGTEVPYLTAASAMQTSNVVIAFDGNDGIALLNSSNAITDRFGQGINAANISYIRSSTVVAPSSTFNASQWTSVAIATVQTAGTSSISRLGYHIIPVCAAPAAQPSALLFTGVTTSSIAGSFTVTAADEYLVVRSTSPTLSASPADGSVYSTGSSLGGGIVISSGSAASFTAPGLSSGTLYYFFIFSIKSTGCSSGPKYLTTTPLTGSVSTALPVCIAPASQPTGLFFGNITSSTLSGTFTGSGANEYLVILSTAALLTANPANGTVYNAGDTLGGGLVISRSTSTSFSATSLNANTIYYIFVFALNNTACSGGPVYLAASPLSASQLTSAVTPTVLNFYNGNLHSHSSYSDGNSDNTTRIPADDYAFAKTAMCMDFLGISEHNHATAGMHLADWQPGIAQAAAATAPDFVALHGQEWGVIGVQGSTGDHAGHMIVYGIDSLIGWEPGNYQLYVPKSTYTGTGGLFEIVNRHGSNALAYCAHPDNYDYNNILNTAYDAAADDAMVGTAVETGPAFSTDTTYTNPSTPSYFAFYKNMLAKGYHVGPTIDHDNHNFTFGHTAKSRLVVLAYTLSENSLLDAMRRMRFYASEDCGAKINFTINAQPLGSILRQASAPVIAVSSITSATVSSIKLMYGVPGSGSVATTLASTTTSTLNFTHTAMANLATGYYFIDITETNGDRIITAPIWYTRDDVTAKPAPVTAFFTVNENDRVTLKWVTTNEDKNQWFEVQRSVDGKDFAVIGNLPGKGFSTTHNNYAIADMQPADGIAYYRLLQKDATGIIKYSETKVVDRGIKTSSYMTVYPNPVHGMLSVKVYAAASESGSIEMFDMWGRRVLNHVVSLIKGEQNIQLNMSGTCSGTYILKIKFGKEIMTRQINKF
jgi:hypothetical protein